MTDTLTQDVGSMANHFTVTPPDMCPQEEVALTLSRSATFHVSLLHKIIMCVISL